jgi:uncharacterized protein (DUF1778 family)
MPSKKLFTQMPDGERKGGRMEVRVTKAEYDEIHHLARIRQMSVSDFMRRAALGRATNVDFETELVLGLSNSTRNIRELHKTFMETGTPPPEDVLRAAIQDTRAAILRISNAYSAGE